METGVSGLKTRNECMCVLDHELIMRFIRHNYLYIDSVINITQYPNDWVIRMSSVATQVYGIHGAYGRHETGWVTISTDEYESMARTIEVLSDKDLMKQIEEGKKNNARVMDFEELADELGI